MRSLWLIICSWLLEQISAEQLQVHIVCHTHDDVGWLKTVDQYYTGQNNSIAHAYVHMILDSVVQSLAANENRTFTYVEQAFFVRWWRQQDEKTMNLVKELVKAGRLEFTNGGWCMHDEAAPHYMDMIDQTTLGHKFLMAEFGVAPRTGWQLDPFGHSATQASLLSSEVGFQGLFFGRIDYQDLALRQQHKEAEFVWRASKSLGAKAQVFTGLTGEYRGNYGPPDGFNWDVGQDDEPMQDDPNLEDYNVKSRVDEFVAAALNQANMTRGNNIMMTMGSDFQYEDAATWYYNLDHLMRHVNADGRVKVFYSTPLRYVEAKQKESQVKWPLKEDDFFPYADGPHKFWTGYFTSRPALKRYIRDTSAFFQVAKQITTLGAASKFSGMEKLAEAMGVAQHHDAVSGTAKQHVTFDYAKRLSHGRSSAGPEVSHALQILMGVRGTEDFTMCELRNVSKCAATQSVGRNSNRTCFALWNGLAKERQELVELPVSSASVEVVEAVSNQAVPMQLVHSLASIDNYGHPAGGSKWTLLAELKLPALGFGGFCLQAAGRALPTPVVENVTGETKVVENDYLALEFRGGMLSRMVDKVKNISTRAEQEWFWYEGSTGNNESSQHSGAYIFRPKRQQALPIFTGLPFMQIIRGELADEVHQSIGSWVTQRWRLGKKASHAELTYTVGEIPVDDGVGKEIVSRISTDLHTDGTCYTDSNGREMIYRKRDYRASWNFNQTEPVAGNYYPVTTSMFIRDEKAQLTLLTDTSQAGTGCVHDGEIEMMVHRRLLMDDGRGVGEPLNETEYVSPYTAHQQGGQHYGDGLVVRGQHWLHFGLTDEAAKNWRPLMDRIYMPPVPFFTQGAVGGKVSFLDALPPNVELLTLAAWDEKSWLLRIGHQFGLGEDAKLSQPATVDLQALFAGAHITSIAERGMGGTISSDEVERRRINWPLDHAVPSPSASSTSPSTTVTLGPLQIRTFLIQITWKTALVI